jgi:hypothetical protein
MGTGEEHACRWVHETFTLGRVPGMEGQTWDAGRDGNDETKGEVLNSSTLSYLGRSSGDEYRGSVVIRSRALHLRDVPTSVSLVIQNLGSS